MRGIPWPNKGGNIRDLPKERLAFLCLSSSRWNSRSFSRCPHHTPQLHRIPHLRCFVYFFCQLIQHCFVWLFPSLQLPVHQQSHFLSSPPYREGTFWLSGFERSSECKCHATGTGSCSWNIVDPIVTSALLSASSRKKQLTVVIISLHA